MEGGRKSYGRRELGKKRVTKDGVTELGKEGVIERGVMSYEQRERGREREKGTKVWKVETQKT